MPSAASSHSENVLLPNPSGVGPKSVANVFSFPALCMLLLVAVIFAFSVDSIAEPDIWWHLRTAKDLLQFHTLTPVDKYSFTAAGMPRMNYEWLSELPYFLAFKVLGLQGVFTVYFTVLVLIYFGVYYRSSGADWADCKNATVSTFVAICMGGISIGPRTFLFGWLCMTGLLLILDRFRNTAKGLWLLPPLFAGWINLHGSWLFGMIVLAVTIASGLVEGEWGSVVTRRWSRQESKSLLLASGISLAALFANPFGYKLVLYPFDFLFHQQVNLQYVEEWLPVNFSTTAGKLTMFMLLALLAAALFSRKKWRLDEVLLLAFALWMGLSHGRFLFFAGLIVAPIITPRLDLLPPYDREMDKPWLNAIIMTAVAAMMIFSFPTAAKLQQQINEQFPVAALDFIERHQLTGHIFNQYGWGGYMVWNTPELKTFIDGRADIFVYNGVFEDFLKTRDLEKPFEVMDKYKIQYVLYPPNRPLAYLLQHSSDWRLVYSDKIAQLFERAPSALPADATHALPVESK